MSENYDISELVDSSLSKNKRKLNKIMNENNFSQEDCILILRTFLLGGRSIWMSLQKYTQLIIAKNIVPNNRKLFFVK